MRLVDLDPRWLVRDGKRIGFTFISPVAMRSDPSKTVWRQSCFVPGPSPPSREQWDLFGDDDVQGCKPGTRWTIAGGIESASFETLTVKPSIDGSAGGLWHGHITNGEIVGGLR